MKIRVDSRRAMPLNLKEFKEHYEHDFGATSSSPSSYESDHEDAD